jgi:Protein of unknown function (DUF664)
VTGVVWTAPRIDRVDEPFTGDERSMVAGRLERCRHSLLYKCAGLTGEQLTQRAVPPSTLSLLGLVRHMTDVERTWFRRRFAGIAVEPAYRREDRPDAAFDEVDPALAEADFGRLTREWDLCRQAVAGATLDDTFVSDRWGVMSLLWVYGHMIEEYARHTGHADLLRERIDGTTGD